MRLRVGRVRYREQHGERKKLYIAANMPWMIITDDEKINEILGIVRDGMRLAGVNGDKKKSRRSAYDKIFFCLSRFCELIKYKFNFLFFTLHHRVLFCAEGIQIPRFFLIITFSYFPSKHLKVYLKKQISHR